MKSLLLVLCILSASVSSASTYFPVVMPAGYSLTRLALSFFSELKTAGVPFEKVSDGWNINLQSVDCVQPNDKAYLDCTIYAQNDPSPYRVISTHGAWGMAAVLGQLTMDAIHCSNLMNNYHLLRLSAFIPEANQLKLTTFSADLDTAASGCP